MMHLTLKILLQWAYNNVSFVVIHFLNIEKNNF